MSMGAVLIVADRSAFPATPSSFTVHRHVPEWLLCRGALPRLAVDHIRDPRIGLARYRVPCALPEPHPALLPARPETTRVFSLKAALGCWHSSAGMPADLCGLVHCVSFRRARNDLSSVR